MKQAKQFKVVECSGTAYEIGRQIGAACRENMVAALNIVLGGMKMMAGASEDAVIENVVKFLPAAQEFNPELMDMLRGQADGAGMSFEQVVTLKCGFDLVAFYPQLSGGCTSFAAAGAATEQGQTLLGQTIDWFPGCPLDLVRIKHADGQEQLSLILWGIIEYTMTSDGLGMCANGTWAMEGIYKQNLPVGIYMPRVMRQRRLEDAWELIQARTRGLAYFTLASEDGRMFGIEGLQDDFEIFAPQNEILVHSNNYLTERFQKFDMVEALVPDSPGRVARIRALMDERHGRLNREIMTEILADHDQHPNAICRHVDASKPPEFASATLAAFIMIPAEGSMWIAYGNPCECEFVEYRI